MCQAHCASSFPCTIAVSHDVQVVCKIHNLAPQHVIEQAIAALMRPGPTGYPRDRRATTAMKKSTTTMKKSNSANEGKGGDSPSVLIDARIKELGDWRGETLARVRTLIKQADPDVVEEVKW